MSETRKPRVLTLSGWVRGQEQEQCVAQKGAGDGALRAGEGCLSSVQKRTQSGGVPLPHCPD